MTDDNKFLLSLLNWSWAIPFSLTHTCLSMRLSVVVAVTTILLFFRLFSFVFYCETTAWDSVATLWNNWLLQNKFNAREQSTYSYKKIGWCAYYSDDEILYAVPRACIKSEVYFGLNNPQWKHTNSLKIPYFNSYTFRKFWPTLISQKCSCYDR